MPKLLNASMITEQEVLDLARQEAESVSAEMANNDRRQTVLHGATTLDRATPTLPIVADFLYATTKGSPSGNTLTLDAMTRDVLLNFSQEDYNFKSRLNVNKTIDTASLPNGTHYVYADYLSATDVSLLTSMIMPEDDYANMKARNSLLHFDGVDGSTTMTDAYGNTWTVNGNAQLDTAQSKFGGSSLLLDGSGDYLTSALVHGGSSFTIEAFVRLNSLASSMGIFGGSGLTASGMYLIFNPSGTRLNIYLSSNGSAWDIALAVVGSKTSWATGTWYHVSVVFNGQTYKVYVDGVEDISVTSSSVLAGGTVNIGMTNGGSDSFNGWIDEFRFTKNGVRYGAAFTPPTQAFTMDAEHFNVPDMTYYNDGITRSSAILRLPIGEFVKSGGAITSVTTYALRGEYESEEYTAAAGRNSYLKSHNIGFKTTATTYYKSPAGRWWELSCANYTSSPSEMGGETGSDRLIAKFVTALSYVYSNGVVLAGESTGSSSSTVKTIANRTY